MVGGLYGRVAEMAKKDVSSQPRGEHGRWTAGLEDPSAAPDARTQSRDEYSRRRAQGDYEKLAGEKGRAKAVGNGEAEKSLGRLMKGVNPQHYHREHAEAVGRLLRDGVKLESHVHEEHHAAANVRVERDGERIRSHWELPGHVPGGARTVSTPWRHAPGETEHGEKIRGAIHLAREAARQHHDPLEVVSAVHHHLAPEGRPAIVATQDLNNTRYEFGVLPHLRSDGEVVLKMHARSVAASGHRSQWHDVRGHARGADAYDDTIRAAAESQRMDGSVAHDPVMKEALAERHRAIANNIAQAEARRKEAEEARQQDAEHENFYRKLEEEGTKLKGKRRPLSISVPGGQTVVPATHYGNLAVHRRLNDEGYAVSHGPTGLTVAAAPTMRAAKGLVHLLHSRGVKLEGSSVQELQKHPDFSLSRSLTQSWRQRRIPAAPTPA